MDEVLESEGQLEEPQEQEKVAPVIDDSHLEVITLDSKRDISDYFLFGLSVLLLVLALIAFFYRNQLLKHFISSVTFPSAHAQAVSGGNDSLVKKKEFLI